ncbi:hypothetical protein CSB11_00040 [Candidatus Campbellbacteria bacterium]|nr:MAG: hypothetical protein CSB11_00040 [Candidatus Campbellbacteria bacterium]
MNNIKNNLEDKKTKKDNKLKKFFGYFLVTAALLLLVIDTIFFLFAIFNPYNFALFLYQLISLNIFEYLNLFQFYLLYIGGFLLDLSFLILILIFGFVLLKKDKKEKTDKELVKNLKLTFFLGLIIFLFSVFISFNDLEKLVSDLESLKESKKLQKVPFQNYQKDYFKGNFHYYENINGQEKEVNKHFDNFEQMDQFMNNFNQ